VSKPVRKVVIAGNWKMNKTRKEGRHLAEQIKAAVSGQKDLPEIILIPPFTSLQEVGACIEASPIGLGAQNMDYHDSGAFTGEISPLMLVDLNAKYVLIGHSERRQYFGETNATVNLRLKAALAHGLYPILCVGETLDERESELTDRVVGRQVAAALADVDQKELAKLIVAYEPVWAIGTGKNCEAVEADRVSAVIRSTIARLYSPEQKGGPVDLSKCGVDMLPVLYGGSVKPSNIEEQLKQPNVDGALVGGASLSAEDFLALVRAGQKLVQERSRQAAAAIS
jgi:triosephosphate isomerase (TIM)